MSLDERDLQLLRRCYLFGGMDLAAYREVVEHAGLVQLAAGQNLFQQGQALTAIYWVIEGMIRLYRVSLQGEEKVIDLVGPGRSFAEAALFMGGHYPVCAAAQSASRLVAIDAAHFRGWLAQDTQHCFRSTVAMSARMQKLLNDIDQLTLLKGTDRLLQCLLDHSDPGRRGSVGGGTASAQAGDRLAPRHQAGDLFPSVAQAGGTEVHRGAGKPHLHRRSRAHAPEPDRMRAGPVECPGQASRISAAATRRPSAARML